MKFKPILALAFGALVLAGCQPDKSEQTRTINNETRPPTPVPGAEFTKKNSNIPPEVQKHIAGLAPGMTDPQASK